MRKEVALASALLFGGASGVEAQEPPAVVEQEKLDVSPFIEALAERVDFDIEPKFFRQMERRARNNPNEFFAVQAIGPNDLRWFYHPDGLLRQPKAAYFEARGFLVGNMDNGVPATIPFVAETQDWYLDLGEDGTLATPNGADLFNYGDLENRAERAFREPKVLKDMPWSRVPFTGSPAETLKLYRHEEEIIEGFPSLSEGWMIRANQSGLLHLSHYERTIE